MVFERFFERVFESLSFIFLIILVWSAVLGLAHPPAWYEFVAYYNSLGGSFIKQTTVSAFFGELVPLLTSSLAPDPVSLTTFVKGEATDVLTIIKALGFIVNLLSGLGYSIMISLALGIVGLFLFFGNIVPLFMGVAYFFAGSFVNNTLPGVVPVINWASMSGQFGYPDPTQWSSVVPWSTSSGV